MKRLLSLTALLLAAALLLCSCGDLPAGEDVSSVGVPGVSQTAADATASAAPTDVPTDAPAFSATTTATAAASDDGAVTLDSLPAYSGSPYVALNGNVPGFTAAETVKKSFERYAPLDRLGRCGVTVACVGKDIMPTEDRGSIGQVKPSGWHTVKYDCVDGKYLYNRCHLIGFQLTGENANTANLITGTRYLNVEGMLPFENLVADYVKETGNHVMYRVTPHFVGDELVARGVVMEARSVEDRGEGVEFHVYCYNVQPGVVIDYASGASRLAQGTTQKITTTKKPVTTPTTAKGATYILNTNSKKFHVPSCRSAGTIKAENKDTFTGNRQALIDRGYSPCGNCDP